MLVTAARSYARVCVRSCERTRARTRARARVSACVCVCGCGCVCVCVPFLLDNGVVKSAACVRDVCVDGSRPWSEGSQGAVVEGASGLIAFRLGGLGNNDGAA